LHLSIEQKRALAAKLLKVDPERSDREIGRVAKLDNKTVAAIRAELEGREEIPHVKFRKDNKGRRHSIKRPGGGRRSPVSPRSAPATLRNDIIHQPEIGEQLSETEVERQITEVVALQPVGAEPVEQGTSPGPSTHQTDDVLTPIKQEWRKLTIRQQQEFLGWARLCLEGKSAKQPQPHSPLEVRDDVTVPTQTPVQCKSRKGVCGYSLCREVGRCLDVRGTAEPAAARGSAA
jgi:hypothetical protein